MKKHGFRSIFSLLLAVMMVCSMLPTAAFAEGDAEEQPVVVETYTVTYADGLGGAAFAEQKTEGLLYGDPTPAFAGEPALDGYTFTGWDKEIAATVTESVTYTAQWQEVQADGQREADGNGEIDTYWGGHHPGGGDRHPGGPGDHGPHPDKPEHDKKLQISLYVDDGQNRDFLKKVNIDRNPESGFAHQIAPLSDVAQGNSGKYGEVTSVTGNWASGNQANVGDTVTWGHDAEDGYVVYNVAPQAAGTITITVKVFDGKQEYTVGSDTAKKANKGVQSEAYVIPELTKFVEPGKFGKVTGVYGNWYWPSTTNRAVGTTIYWSNNSSTGTMIYYVDWYNPNGGGDNPTTYLWNFTLKYDANGGTGAPADQTYGSNDKYYKSHTFNIPSTVPTREGYTFKGWSDTKGGGVTCQPGGTCLVSQTVSGYNGGSVTKTLYAVWEENKPTAPTKPTEDDIIDGEILGDVTIECTNTSVQHGSKSYPLTKESITEISDVTFDENAQNYSCMVTVSSTDYVHQFNTDKGGTHTPDDRTKSIQLLYYADAWHGPSGDAASIIFKVACTESPEPPTPDIEKPTFDELKELLSVKVECTNESATHELKFDRYKLKDVDEDSKFAIGEVDQSGDVPTCTVTIGSKPYVAAFDNTTGKTHEQADTTRTVNLVYNKETGKWALENENDATVVFRVACTTEEPSKPYKPKAEDLLSVVIHCKSDVHNDGRYDLTDGIFTVGEVEGNEADGYTCKVTVEAAQYVNKYVGEMKVNHDIVGEDTKTVTLKYESALERWTVDSTVVTFDVECIPAPNISMLQVQVHCVTPNSSHMDGFYDLPEDTTLEYVDANTRRITVQAAPYVEQYGNGHKLADGESGSKTITATWDGVKWNFNAASVTFDVKCTTQEGPAAPTAEQVASLLKVKVSCANLSAAHQKDVPAFVYQPLLTGSFVIGEVTGNALSGYACRITVRAARYVQDFNTRSNAMHAPTDGTEKAVTLYYEDGSWTVGTGSGLVEFTVICENVPAQKYTVTYTDGVDGVEIFKDQVYADLTAGTATPKFNGTPTRVGYFFAGWNPAVADTVTGNVTYTATWKVDSNNNGKPDDEEERYTVTYLDGANGKAFASQVYPGLLSGTATPKFNGTPARSGYVFIGWSPVWSGTVTGNVTYTATWSTITGGLDKVPKTGDNGLTLALSALLLFSFCGAAACVVSTKKRG